MKLETIVLRCIESKIGKSVISIGVMSALSPITSEYRGELWYHLSATAAYVAAASIDHLVTVPLIKLMNTDEFKRNGLRKVFRENSFILGKHPTLEQYVRRSAYRDIPGVLLTTLFAGAAYAYLTMTPLIYWNNKRVEKEIQSLLS